MDATTRRGATAAVLGLGLACQFLPPGFPAAAEDTTPSPPAQTVAGLGNMRFVGPMGIVGESSSAEDAFLFEDGKFVSESCLKWGFSAAPYWLRAQADGLHFLAELTSPDHGTMRYQGVYDGEKISGTVVWRKERWYWTIERQYHFSGHPAGPEK